MALPTITAEMLEAKGACQEQVEVFRKHWPDGARLTKSALIKAARLKLDLGWFADEFLGAAALAEYNKVRAAALAEVVRKHGMATQEGERQGPQ